MRTRSHLPFCALLLLTGSAFGGSTVHVVWDEEAGEQPIFEFHYFILNQGSNAPTVQIRKPSNYWRIWSEDPQDPQNVGRIGDIQILETEETGNYSIALATPSHGQFARVAGNIHLTPPNTNQFATIRDSDPQNPGMSVQIDSLTGDFIVQAAGGNGGRCPGLTIGQPTIHENLIAGTIDIPEMYGE